MFSKSDRKYLKNPAYSMALEKFFSREIDSSYYFDQNDKHRKEQNIRMNTAIEWVYPYSNEDLLSTFRPLDLQDKTVACTGSGGDHILMAIAMGAKKIIHVDGNLYAEPFIRYKLAAMQTLTHKEFKKYFIDHADYFQPEVYQKLFHCLDADAQVFWGTIFMEKDNPVEIKNRIVQVQTSGYEHSKALLGNKEFYEYLQSRLQAGDFELEIQTAEFSDFPQAIGQSCDMIFLSNIQQYVNQEEYVKTINKLYNKNLNPGGKIQLSYTFSANSWGRPAEDLTPKFQTYFKSKAKNISMQELDNNDKTFYLEKPKTLNIEKD